MKIEFYGITTDGVTARGVWQDGEVSSGAAEDEFPDAGIIILKNELDRLAAQWGSTKAERKTPDWFFMAMNHLFPSALDMKTDQPFSYDPEEITE